MLVCLIAPFPFPPRRTDRFASLIFFLIPECDPFNNRVRVVMSSYISREVALHAGERRVCPRREYLEPENNSTPGGPAGREPEISPRRAAYRGALRRSLSLSADTFHSHLRSPFCRSALTYINRHRILCIIIRRVHDLTERYGSSGLSVLLCCGAAKRTRG